MADEYRSRDLLQPNGVIEVALRHLDAAAARTDPNKPGSALGKDHQALRALLRSRTLVDAAAGWALDHVYGLSLAGHKMVPSQPSGIKDHPDYLASRVAADVHDHEREGGARIDQAPASPELRRLVLRNLVYAGASNFPEWLREELIGALDALDHGTTVPLLTATDIRGTDIRKSRGHLRFICFVKFRHHAYGITISKAREYVAARIGCEPATLDTWEKRLKNSGLDALDIEREIAFTRNAAGYVRVAIEKGEQATQDDLDLRAWHERAYGHEALRAAIEEWNSLRRGSK